MKTYNKFLIALLSIAVLTGLVMSCMKESNNIATSPPQDEKSIGISWSITFSAGHKPDFCPGCWIAGAPPPVHMPCWAWGSECQHTITIDFSIFKSLTAEDAYSGKFELENEVWNHDTIVLPARSIDPSQLEDCEFWLNWPAQTVFRNSGSYSNTFNIDSLFFSEDAYYNND